MTEPVTHSLVKALQAVPAFAAFDERTLVRIVGTSANLFWPAGGAVFEKGEESEALYIVLSGLVQICDVREDGQATEVAQLGPGEFFGELSLLLHTTHTKRALAAEDTELMVIPKASFQELLASYPELAAEFRQKVEQRLAAQPAVARLT